MDEFEKRIVEAGFVTNKQFRNFRDKIVSLFLEEELSVGQACVILESIKSEIMQGAKVSKELIEEDWSKGRLNG